MPEINKDKNKDKNKNKKDEKITPLNSQMTLDDILEKEESDSENEDSGEGIPIEEQEITYDGEGNINRGIKNIIHDSMMPYSEYVILDRALPRIEDGFKPVQRRILYSMYQLGLFPDKPFKKSAKVVGDCMANYHPHGDSSVYNAMVRMTQDFNMSEPLVNGHGNFGSMDGDSPAAMRYTEAKLESIATELLKDIDKNTVTWAYNYDDTKKEPEILPSKFPNLLVNGSSGIAVGLATNIPPHNLAETIDAITAYIEKKSITLEEIMQYIKGPDFPLGGIIIGTEGIKNAYETGKGKIVIRAKTSIENMNNGKKRIVIDEFPYQVNKAKLLRKIADLRENHKDILSGITNIQDESDRNGVRAIIELKKDSDVNLILNYLYKNTDLQVNFSTNIVAIADGKPRQLNLLDIIKHYTEYQRKVIYNRSNFDLDKYNNKKHILDGLLISIKNIDRTIQIIKTAPSIAQAKKQLEIEFKLTEKQSQAILDMKLARLNNLEVDKLKEEISVLTQKIEKLTLIVNSKQRQMTIVKKEMLEIKKKYARPRRTKIIEDARDMLEFDESQFETVKETVIGFNQRNCIKKIPIRSFNRTGRVITSSTKANEIHHILFETKTDRDVLLFTNKGMTHRISLKEVNESKWKDRGDVLTKLIPNFKMDEKVIAAFPINKEIPNKKIIFFTSNGMVKISKLSEYNVSVTSFEAIKLKEEDEVINVDLYNSLKNMCFVTKEGMGLHAKTESLSSQGRTTVGVKGIDLSKSDKVIYASLVKDMDKIAVITNKGYTKKIEVSELSILERNRKGVKLINFSMDNGFNLVYSGKANHKYEINVVNSKNKNISINTEDIPLQTRLTKGKLVHGKNPIKIKNIYKYEWESRKFAYDREDSAD